MGVYDTCACDLRVSLGYLVSGSSINPLNAELNPICPLLALLGAHHILHVSGVRVKYQCTIHGKVQVTTRTLPYGINLPFGMHGSFKLRRSAHGYESEQVYTSLVFTPSLFTVM
jgi:hypothetical protein